MSFNLEVIWFSNNNIEELDPTSNLKEIWFSFNKIEKLYPTT